MTTDLTGQIYQYLTTAPASLFAQREVTILAHWEGDANLLWRVKVDNQEAVVKLFLDAGQARSRRQNEAHQLFAPLGLAPEPLWADRYPTGLSRQLFVYRWVDGEVVDAGDPALFSAWAEAIATLHSAHPSDVRRVSPHPLNLGLFWRIEQESIIKIVEWLRPSGLAITTRILEIAQATTAFVEAGLPLWETALPTLVHGDLSRQHTLVERGRILLLDWEMYGLGDPAMDVARLLQREAQTLKPTQIEEWLATYVDNIDHPELAERIAVYRRLLDVHNVVYLLIGLQQNTVTGLSVALSDAIPFMQEALSIAMDQAARSLLLARDVPSYPLVSDFFNWLVEATPTLAKEL